MYSEKLESRDDMLELEVHNNPSGDAYRQLIDVAFDKSERFHLVVRKEFALSDRAKQLLDDLKPSLMKKVTSSEWASTVLVEGTADVYYYKADQHAHDVLQRAANTLYDWQQPDLPEDVAFFKAQGEAWLAASSREAHCHLTITHEELQQLAEKIPTLTLDE